MEYLQFDEKNIRWNVWVFVVEHAYGLTYFYNFYKVDYGNMEPGTKLCMVFFEMSTLVETRIARACLLVWEKFKLW
jgi:hypothetical protein